MNKHPKTNSIILDRNDNNLTTAICVVCALNIIKFEYN